MKKSRGGRMTAAKKRAAKAKGGNPWGCGMRIASTGPNRILAFNGTTMAEFAKKMPGAYDLLQQALTAPAGYSADAEKLSATYDRPEPVAM